MPAFTFEKLPAPPRPERAPQETDNRSSFNRLLDRFAEMRLRRAAADFKRSASAEKSRKS